jgi:hypothetical protein
MKLGHFAQKKPAILTRRRTEKPPNCKTERLLRKIGGAASITAVEHRAEQKLTE